MVWGKSLLSGHTFLRPNMAFLRKSNGLGPKSPIWPYVFASENDQVFGTKVIVLAIGFEFFGETRMGSKGPFEPRQGCVPKFRKKGVSSLGRKIEEKEDSF